MTRRLKNHVERDEDDKHWASLMAMTGPQQRQKALRAALVAFDASLSEQDCWIPDAMARAATLSDALAEYGDLIETQLAGTTGTLH